MTGRKVVLCTHSSLYSGLVLSQLLEADGLEVAGIVNSTRILKPAQGRVRGALELVDRVGLHYALYLFCLTDRIIRG